MEIMCRLTFGLTTPRQFLTEEMDLTVLGSPTQVRTLSVVKRVPGEPPPMLWFADSRDPLPVKWPSILPHLIKHRRKVLLRAEEKRVWSYIYVLRRGCAAQSVDQPVRGIWRSSSTKNGEGVTIMYEPGSIEFERRERYQTLVVDLNISQRRLFVRVRA